MKKLFAFVASFAMLFTSCYDDSAIQSRLEALCLFDRRQKFLRITDKREPLFCNKGSFFAQGVSNLCKSHWFGGFVGKKSYICPIFRQLYENSG